MSTAQDLPLPYGEAAAGPALRLVPEIPLDFDDAVRRVRPRLHRFAVRRLGDLHEAEELVQEALLRAYSHRAQLMTEDDLAAWATVVTGRLVIDRLRVRGRSTSVAEVPEGSRVGRDTADVVVAREEARFALDALDAMPSRQSALLWAREVEGRSYEELCERFGMSEPAVRSVLTRARKALRKEYAARGGTLPAGGLAVLAPWITGLTFAGRIRRAISRIGTPAALSAIGITALGGLVLSPFGGRASAPGLAPFHPSQAVVSALVTDSPRSFRDVTPAAAGVRPSVRVAKTRPSALLDLRSINHKCVDTNPNGGTFISAAGHSVGRVSAGGRNCSQSSETNNSTYYLTPTLPDNPTHMHQVGVTSDLISCASMPVTPITQCDPPQQGAPK